MKKKDLILIGMLFLLALVLGGAVWLFHEPGGEKVRITLDGEEYAVLLLSEEQMFDIDTQYGHNRICIQDGCVVMEEADCPDGYCRKQGAIKTSGQSIVCLPHRLVVEITGNSARKGDETDAVAK